MSQGTEVASLKGVGKRFGQRWALRGVDLTLREAEVVGFIGPNGAGKTTLMRLLSGLQRATEGELTVLGRRLDTGTLHAPEGIGMVMEDSGFVPSLSGLKNLELLASLRGVAGDARIMEVLAQVGLDPHDRRPVRTWSLGMRQRLSLAQALMEEPRLLLLDEPTNGLDPAGIVDLRGMLAKLAQGGTSIFLASHLLTEVEQLCHRVLLVRDGVVRRELAGTSGSTGLRVLVTGEEDVASALAWAREQGLLAARLPDERGHPVLRLAGALAPTPQVIRELVARGVGMEEFGPLRQSLEETFLALTDEGRAPAGGSTR